ncbi:G-protein alpha subunit-domain-containing protein [Russula vinacea]|nr:G-protein alpha subunit-domain-containing protein [Russula vinacea]
MALLTLHADILKARIQTLGIEEHPLRVEANQAAAWLPYFDDGRHRNCRRLVFVAPVSAFNQTLTEDRSVNRLVRLVSLMGFVAFVEVAVRTQVVEKGDFCITLNKYDLLDAKLQSGIQFREFVTSYKDRPNKTDDALHYLKGNFSAIYQQDPQKTLTLHVHITCATDSNSTSIVHTRTIGPASLQAVPCIAPLPVAPCVGRDPAPFTPVPDAPPVPGIGMDGSPWDSPILIGYGGFPLDSLFGWMACTLDFRSPSLPFPEAQLYCLFAPVPRIGYGWLRLPQPPHMLPFPGSVVPQLRCSGKSGRGPTAENDFFKRGAEGKRRDRKGGGAVGAALSGDGFEVAFGVHREVGFCTCSWIIDPTYGQERRQ